MKNLFKILSIFSAFLLFSCSCANKTSKKTIGGVSEKESVIPKLDKSNEALKKISKASTYGGEQILKLQIRTTNALLLAEKQRAEDLKAKLQVISDELEMLGRWNRNQTNDLRALESSLTDVEIALNIKENEVQDLRKNNNDLRVQAEKAQEEVETIQEEVLKVKAESEVKIAEIQKKMDALKKYRNICFAIGGLLGAGILFKLFGPRLF
jgi:predicted  nucleic acid-binding Zn-ribbon protein